MADRCKLGYQAKWSFEKEEPSLSACYAACRGHLPTNRALSEDGFKYIFSLQPTCTWTELHSYFHFCPQEIKKEELDWWWNTVFLPAIPDRVQPYVKVTEGSTFQVPIDNAEYEIPYKTLTVQFRQLSWDDILTLFTFARTMQESPNTIVKAYEMAHTYPKCTPDMAFYFGLVYKGCYQPEHLLLSASWQKSINWSKEEVKQYSFKIKWDEMQHHKPMQDKASTHIQTSFAIKNPGQKHSEDMAGYIHESTKRQFTKDFIEMVS